MSTLYEWLRLLHIAAAFTFIMGHGVSVALAFRLKKETNLPRVQAMFDLSASMFFIYIGALFIMVVDGIILSFMGEWWSKGWVWIALTSLLVVAGWMGFLAQRTYHPLRKALGIPYQRGIKEMPPEPPLSEGERVQLISRTKPELMLLVGYGGFLIALWLMMFKPF